MACATAKFCITPWVQQQHAVAYVFLTGAAVKKTPEEIKATERVRNKKKQEKVLRKKQQEENIRRKEQQKEEHKQKCIEGQSMSRDITLRMSDVQTEAAQSDEDDDEEYYRQEVGEAPPRGIVFNLSMLFVHHAV